MESDSTVAKQPPATAAPWGTVTAPKPESLSEVMSEQLAHRIHDEQESIRVEQMLRDEALALSLQQQLNGAGVVDAPDPADEAPAADAAVIVDDADNDRALALSLQQEYDREYNRGLKLSEERLNSGNQKIRVTLASHRLPEAGGSGVQEGDYEDEEDDDDDDWRDVVDSSVSKTKTTTAVPTGRRRGRGGISADGLRTKHDAEINGRRNADKLSGFGLGFREGDTSGLDVRLTNRVYNALKQHSDQTERRQARVHDRQDRSTAESAVDEKTRAMLFRMINAGRLASLGGIVATGKESVVLHAYCDDSSQTPAGKQMPREVAIKVFKTSLNEFKSRSAYVTGDFRVCKDALKWQNPRKVMRVWCEKELLSLRRLQKFNLPCPTPLMLTNHVLVMSFIGEAERAAPRLKDCRLEPLQWRCAWEQAESHLHRLYHDCQLVHADFSEYNLLWWRNTVWIIDVSQAVDRGHPMALEFLLRDCKNACAFFGRQGALGTGEDAADAEALFNKITGLNISGRGEAFAKRLADHVASRTDFEGDRVHLDHGVERREYQFEYYFKEGGPAVGDEEETESQDADYTDEEVDSDKDAVVLERGG